MFIRQDVFSELVAQHMHFENEGKISLFGTRHTLYDKL